jgi:hypothetical protein
MLAFSDGVSAGVSHGAHDREPRGCCLSEIFATSCQNFPTERCVSWFRLRLRWFRAGSESVLVPYSAGVLVPFSLVPLKATELFAATFRL